MTASELRNQILAQAADDEAFRARLLEDPRMALREDYDIVLPENMTLKEGLNNQDFGGCSSPLART